MNKYEGKIAVKQIQGILVNADKTGAKFQSFLSRLQTLENTY